MQPYDQESELQYESDIVPDIRMTPKLREEIEEYVKDWCAESREFVRQYEPQWQLAWLLYLNKIGMQEWKDGSYENLKEDTNMYLSQFRLPSAREKSWRSDYIHSPGHLIDNWADNSYLMLTSPSDWLTCVPEEPVPGDSETPYTAAFRFQQLLLDKLAKGKNHLQLYIGLKTCCLFGSAYAKITWDVPQTVLPVKITDEFGSDREYLPSDRPGIPIIKHIPLDHLLPDWAADDCDVQRWTGIGHRMTRTYKEIEAGFAQGLYNLNEKKFKGRWKDGAAGPDDTETHLYDFGDHQHTERHVKDTQIQVTEWHGRVPTSQGFIECVVTLADDQRAEDAQSALCIRLDPVPVLQQTGLRPFVGCHFTPQPGPFGLGQIDRNKDLLFQLSQFMGQMADVTRMGTDAITQYDENNPRLHKIIKQNDGRFPPGQAIGSSDMQIDALRPLKLFDIDINAVSHEIQFLNSLLERRTTTPDVWLGISQTDKTATEAGILQQQAQQPTQCRVDLIARNYVAPAARLALEFIREFSNEDQLIFTKLANGAHETLVITQDELEALTFEVVATIVKPDHNRIAKAQAIERFLAGLPNVLPLLQGEGMAVQVGELTKRWLDFLGVEGSDRIVRPLSEEEKQALMQQQMMEEEMAMAQGGVEGNAPTPDGPPGGPPNGDGNLPPQLAMDGGPMGEEPTDMNVLAQLMQEQARMEEQGDY